MDHEAFAGPPEPALGRPPAWAPAAPEPSPPTLHWRRPLLLFVLTCASTFVMGGPVYAAAVMTILLTHELGHYLQARRYRVRASLPYFIPLPLLSPLGTMGAVIVMRERIASRRALFDIGITGPLAGLVPALLCTVVGIRSSQVTTIEQSTGTLWFGEPLLFQLLSRAIHGEIPDGSTLLISPLAFAGWVGIFITALNLLPVGQLDGGHILYALIGRRSYRVVVVVLAAAVVAIVVGGYWQWLLLVALLLAFRPFHPPTADDHQPLGAGRHLLGWLTLLFFVLGFTANPWGFGPTP